MKRVFADRLPPGFSAAIGSAVDPLPESRLTQEEERRLASFGLDRRRSEFVLGRRLIRWLAAETLDAASPVEITVREDGSLFLPGPDCHVSLAHSDGRAAVVVGPSRVGIDLEVIKKRDPGLLDRILTDAEREHLQRFAVSEEVAPVMLWTVKEAVLKACGSGLRAGLRSIEVRSMSESEAIVRDRGQNWRVYISQMDGLCLSVALETDLMDGDS
jgi:phosphopantetheinyl transferase